MRAHASKRTTPSLPRSLFQRLVALSLAVALPAQAIAGTVELATSPMANSATTTVKPNLMFVLDDSGSMDWDYMPDVSHDFANAYGFNSSQCNGIYYNPSVTYSAPVKADGTPLNATATTFTAAYKDGYSTGSGTVNLNSGFKGGTQASTSAVSYAAGPAFYYVYSGTQTTPALKNYFDSNSTFYKECNSGIGSSPGSGVFTLRRLASTATTTLTINLAGGGASITVNTNNTKTRVSSVKVTIGGSQKEILSGSTSKTKTSSTIASDIANLINACTSSTSGNCQVSGFSASATGNVVSITPAIGNIPDNGTNPAASTSAGSPSFSYTAFTGLSSTTVTSIRVGSTELLSSSASGSGRPQLATDIASKITATGYSASASSNVVTVTGPSSASNQTPAITISSGNMTVSTLPFPESDPAQLQNFANWFSYYSTRMIMMKTGAGLAFQNVSDAFRVGFATMNNNVSPGFLSVDTFSGTQKTNFYSKLYAANPSNSTPLREILSRVGQYYAHKFGQVDKYTATITVGSSGSTSVDSILVGTTELMNDSSTPDTSTSQVAKNVAIQINAPLSTDYGASTSGSVITITGPASALGQTPVASKDGNMTLSATAFVKTTTTANFNGVTPPDPVQYSCQQNFTILSTDGYWNGPSTYDLSNASVGQQDGTGVPRPYNDGAQSSTTYTKYYTKTKYSREGSSGPCSWPNRPETSAPQTGSCTTSNAGADCSQTISNWTGSTYTRVSPLACIGSGSIPSDTPAVFDHVTSTSGTVGGISNTLADVAYYYYQTDLRDNALANCTGALGTSVCENNVFISGSDNQTQQHMTTFTLGLGVRGRMIYSASYLTDTSGDFVDVKLGTTADSTHCTWQSSGTVCNWPQPSSGSVETTDDLWHAAVNGRGAYFSATDPVSLGNALAGALVSIKSKVGAAAAAATSTLNPVAGNNQAFVASYTTQKWTGNLEARGINTETGAVNENANWCVENVTAGSCQSPGTIVAESTGDTTTYFCSTPNQVTCSLGVLDGTDCKVPVATSCTGTMNSVIAQSTDTRLLYTANDAGTALTPFDTAYRAAHTGYFDSTNASQLTQWSTFDATQKTAAQGDNLINYLRGQWGHEYDRSTIATADQLFRKRDAVLGDALESQPAFIAGPVFSYPYPGYAEYKTLKGGRAGTVYMGTNDGMMHAFASDTGAERWAYVPSMVIPNLWKLADKNYADLHTNYVNGSPITQDICTANCSGPVTGNPATDPVWKTILVAGLNAGGRGFFALDITDPASPSLLWEFTTTAGIGKVKDKDLGYSYAQPVVTRKNDGTWVVLVTSGYDNGTDSAAKVSGSFVANSPAGDGKGYLYVLNAATGALINKISTNVGTAANPSGLGKIAGFNGEPGGNLATYVYGGDLLGNLWRFDINAVTAFKFATLFSDAAGTLPQPIMTTPLLGTILGKRVVFIGTGKYLEVSDLTDTQVQSQYAIKDDDATTTLTNARNSLVQQFLINNPDGSATRLSAASASATVTGSNAVDFGANRGWFVDLPDSRERVNIDAKLIEGTLIVPSIVPSSTECAPGGTGWLNFFDYKTGAAVVPEPGVSSVKYDSTIVGINVLFISGNPVVEVVTSTNPTPSIDPSVQFAASAATFAGKRVLWRELVP